MTRATKRKASVPRASSRDGACKRLSRCDDGERRTGRREWTMTRDRTRAREDGGRDGTRRSLGNDDERRARAVWKRESAV